MVRVIRVEISEVFLNISGTVWNSDQTLHADRHYGDAGAGSQEFMTFRIGAAWERGKFMASY